MRSLLALLCFLVFDSAIAKDHGFLQYRNDLTTEEQVRVAAVTAFPTDFSKPMPFEANSAAVSYTHLRAHET